MSFFSKLFGSKEKTLEELLASLKEAQRSKNFVSIARLYYEIGSQYYKLDDKLKARLYLNRFDTLTSSQDSIYSKISEKWMDEASEWIDDIDSDDSLFINEMASRVEELSEDLTGRQKIQWNLLTLARFETLFKRLSTLPGFAVFADYKKVLNIYSQSLYRAIDQSEYETILKFVQDFYPFTDSLALADASNRIPVPGGADFEAYDLIGSETLLNIYTLIDDLTQLTEIRIDSIDVTTDVISNSLLTDYYIRTAKGDISTLPAIKTEENRIMDDYKFVTGSPDKERFLERFEQYRKLSLPA